MLWYLRLGDPCEHAIIYILKNMGDYGGVDGVTPFTSIVPKAMNEIGEVGCMGLIIHMHGSSEP